MKYSYDRTAKTYRTAAQSIKMGRKVKMDANATLRRYGFDGNKRFKKIGMGLTEAFSILAKFGIEADETLNAHKFPEKKGSANVDLAMTNWEDSHSPFPISNSMLHLQWEDLSLEDAHAGSVEIVAYLT